MISNKPFYLKEEIYSGILKFHELDNKLRWVFADELLHKSCLLKKNKFTWGFYGNIINRLIAISSFFGFEFLFLGILGFLFLTRIYFLQFSVKKLFIKQTFQKRLSNFEYIYFSFGAAKEEEIFKYYCQKKKQTVLKIEQNEILQLSEFQKLGILQLLLSFLNSMKDIRKALKITKDNYMYKKNSIYTSLSKRVAYYTFMKLWFIKLKKNNKKLKEICFSNADTAAFASTAAKIKTRYIQHGFISSLIIFPDFNIFESLTIEEKNYFKNIFPNSLVKLKPFRKIRLKPVKPPKILIVSIPELKNLNSFFFDALSHYESLGCEIYIRLHPREQFKKSVWYQYNLPFKYKVVSNEINFEQVIENIKPRITIAWPSTAIIDLLRSKLVVTSLCQDSDQDFFVYPIKKYTLNFLNEQNSIIKILLDDNYYMKYLNKINSSL